MPGVPSPNNSRLSLRHQDEFVRKRGSFFSWAKGFICPCSMEGDGSRPIAFCSACKGTGYLYLPATRLRGIPTVLTEENLRLAEVGLPLPGDCLLILSPKDVETPTQNDKIIFEDYAFGNPLETDIVRRGTQPTDNVLKYTPLEFISVASVDYTTGTISLYIQGVDFTISGRALTWLAGKGPPSDTYYALKYRAQFEWIVVDNPHIAFERNTYLGAKILLRKRHLMGR